MSKKTGGFYDFTIIRHYHITMGYDNEVLKK